MDKELNTYLELGSQMNFSYIPYIPFCVFITWYKNPELRNTLSWVHAETSLSEYKIKYNEFLYFIHIEDRKCINTIKYDMEYANNWIKKYMSYKTLSHKRVYCFNYAYYNNGIFQVSHALKLIHNTISNTLEIFDSLRRKNNKRFGIGKVYSKVYEMIGRIAQKMPSKPLVIPIFNIYGTNHLYGLQEIEYRLGYSGYCILWSELIGELSLKFLEKTTGEIVDDIMCFSQEQDKSAAMVLRLIIQGYLVDFCNQTGVNFTDEILSYKSCCDYFTRI